MKIRKALLLASMAVAAIAFAAPAGASASGHFTINGKPVSGSVDVKFTGVFGIGNENGSYGCEAHPVLTVETKSATIKDLGLTTNDCEGFGAFAHCHLNAHELTAGATLTPTANQINLKKFKLFTKFETGAPSTTGETSAIPCGLAGLPAGVEWTFEEITLTPDNPNGITSVEPSGSGTLDAIGIGPIATTEIFGEMEAENPGELSLMAGE